jgi:uncharacterized low-complexity protein
VLCAQIVAAAVRVGRISIGIAHRRLTMNRFAITAVMTLALAVIMAGVAFAVSSPGPDAVTDRLQGVVIRPATTTPVVNNVADLTAPAELAKPAVAQPSKAPKPITGAVVRDPDDCGDVCVDSKLDSDDCGIDHCSDDAKSAPAKGKSAVDDDGDGDGGDCGQADGE